MAKHTRLFSKDSPYNGISQEPFGGRPRKPDYINPERNDRPRVETHRTFSILGAEKPKKGGERWEQICRERSAGQMAAQLEANAPTKLREFLIDQLCVELDRSFVDKKGDEYDNYSAKDLLIEELHAIKETRKPVELSDVKALAAALTPLDPEWNNGQDERIARFMENLTICYGHASRIAQLKLQDWKNERSGNAAAR